MRSFGGSLDGGRVCSPKLREVLLTFLPAVAFVVGLSGLTVIGRCRGATGILTMLSVQTSLARSSLKFFVDRM